jgi:hypothetical protein
MDIHLNLLFELLGAICIFKHTIFNKNTKISNSYTVDTTQHNRSIILGGKHGKTKFHKLKRLVTVKSRGPIK